MHKRPFFWLGLLLGAFATFGTRQRWLPKPLFTPAESLLDLAADALIVCDALGTVTYANAAATRLGYGDLSSLARLYYPSGQRVPPGQFPQARALRTGKIIEAAGYRYVHRTDDVRVLDVTATPLPAGGVAVVFRDSTVLETALSREALAEARQNALHSLCRRLCAATDAPALAQAVAESTVDLLSGLPEARAEVIAYDPAARTLTRLAVMPETPAKPPKSLRETQLFVTAFDASLPLHWQMYVAKQPSCSIEDSNIVYALPLIAGGSTIGHLTVTCATSAAFEDAELCAVLASMAAVAALALAGPQAVGQAAHLASQVEALRRIVQAVAADTDLDMLADLITMQACLVIGAELCTMLVRDGAGIRLLGKDYQDALLRPERHSADDSSLWDKVAQKAMRTGKTVVKTGIANPRSEIGPWRAFAGQSGRHSVLAVPLVRGQGALTVYAAGATGFSEAHVKFVETLAALFPATRPEVPASSPT